MRLHRLNLINFRQHRSTEIRFPHHGMIGLLGPNAVGKTSVIEALVWAFYGAGAIRKTVAGLRWKRARPRETTEVQVDFEHGGLRFELVRKESKATLAEVGNRTPRAVGTEAVTREVAGILGMELDEFQTTYYCQQLDLNRLGKMGPTVRTQFVMRMAQVDRIDTAIEEARKRKNAITSERRGLMDGIGERDPHATEVADASDLVHTRGQAADEAARCHNRRARAVDKTQAALAAAEEARTRHAAAVQARDIAQNTLPSVQGDLLRSHEDLQRAAEAEGRVPVHELAVEPLPALRAERDQLIEARAQTARRASLEAAEQTVTTRLAEIETRIDGARAAVATADPDSLPEAERRAAEATATLQQLRSARERAHAVAEAAGRAAVARAARLNERIDSLRKVGPAGECPGCGRVLGAQFERTLADLVSERDSASAEHAASIETCRATQQPDEQEVTAERTAVAAGTALRAADQRSQDIARSRQTLATLQEDQARRTQELAHLRTELAGIPSLGWSAPRFEDVEREIARLAIVQEALMADRAIASQKTVAADRHARATAEAARVQEEIAAASNAIADACFDPAAYTSLLGDSSRETAALSEQARTVATTAAELTAANDRLDRAERALRTYDHRAAQADRLGAAVRLLEETVEGLLAFRRSEADAIRPDLEERTARYLSILSDGRYADIRMDESFGVMLIEAGQEMEVVSGGSEDIAALATRLALAEMATERASAPITLLMLDEPLGSLAVQWRNNVLLLIRSLSSYFEQVILISHHSEISDGVDLALSLEYSEAEGCTRIAA